MLFGFLDLTVVVILAYLWLLNKWGVKPTRLYRALLVVFWITGFSYSLGLRL